MTSLQTTTDRLSDLVRSKLGGAELQEFKLKDESSDERRYVVRWSREGGGTGRDEYGTHVACLHDDGRSMLVWGDYFRSEREALTSYEGRV
jgi:hypothetical protein